MKENNSKGKKSPSGPARAKSVVGKFVLIGLTYLDAEGQIVELRQYYGKITVANKHQISVKLQGLNEGEIFNLPPGKEALIPAPPGEYRLVTTKEIVKDPDFLATYEMKAEP